MGGGWKRAREDSNLRPTVSAVPAVSRGAGPSHRPFRGSPWCWRARVVGAGRFRAAATSRRCGGRSSRHGAGVLLGQLTRWSLHLSSADASRAATDHPAEESARDCPFRVGARVCRDGVGAGCGFPRIHPVRLPPFPTGAPLFEGNRCSILLSYERGVRNSFRLRGLRRTARIAGRVVPAVGCVASGSGYRGERSGRLWV